MSISGRFPNGRKTEDKNGKDKKEKYFFSNPNRFFFISYSFIFFNSISAWVYFFYCSGRLRLIVKAASSNGAYPFVLRAESASSLFLQYRESDTRSLIDSVLHIGFLSVSNSRYTPMSSVSALLYISSISVPSSVVRINPARLPRLSLTGISVAPACISNTFFSHI